MNSSTTAGPSECCGASTSSVSPSPPAPATIAFQLARESAAESRPPTSAPAPKQAAIRPKTPGPESRVRQLAPPDHLEGQLLARRRVEHEHDPGQHGERVDHPHLHDAGKHDPGKRRRYHHPDRLRDDHGAPGVQPVDDHPGHQAKDAERHELAGGQHADREGRMCQRENEPGLSDLVDPGAALRHGLAEEIETVIRMHTKAREGAAVDRQDGGGHSSISSCNGSIAASTASSSASERRVSRAANQAVRRDLTERSTRSPSGETRRPTRLRSSSEGSRTITPAASRRPTYLDIPGADIRSRAASSRTPIPGRRWIVNRREACPPVTPSE